MSYIDFLASRGYTRIRFAPTEKEPGHLVLGPLARPVERIPKEERTVVAIRGKRKAGL